MSDFAILCVNTFSTYIGTLPFLIILQIFSRKYKLPKRHQFGLYVYALAICAILTASGTPSFYEIHFYPQFNLIPFAGFSDNLSTYVQNFLVFIPFGLLLPTLWQQFRPAKVTIFYGFFFSLLIELSQLFNYSTTDINDLIMNTLGTITGYFIFMQIKDMRFMGRLCLATDDEFRRTLSQWEVYIYFFTPFIIAFLLTPFISNQLWDIIWDTFVGIPI